MPCAQHHLAVGGGWGEHVRASGKADSWDRASQFFTSPARLQHSTPLAARYAHRQVPSLLVMEVEVLASGASTSASGQSEPVAFLQLTPRATDTPRPQRGVASDDIHAAPAPPSPPPVDINFTAVPNPPVPDVVVNLGWTQIAETPSRDGSLQSNLTQVGILASNTSGPGGSGGMWPMTPGQTRAFVTVIRTSLETMALSPNDDSIVAALAADYAVAQELQANGTLRSSHEAEWARTVWTGGFEVEGRPDVAVAVNASLYGIMSAIRADRPFGISPGGLTEGYYGEFGEVMTSLTW